MTIILFEGIDGTGKTTVAKDTAEKLGYEYIKFPTPWYYERSKECDSLYANRYLNMVDMYRMANKLRTTNVVLDRYLPSQMAYSTLLPENNNVEFWRDAGGVLPIPDIMFYFKCSIKTSWERLKNSRLQLDEQFETLDKLEVVKRYYEVNVKQCLEEYAWNIYKIDVEQSLDEVIRNVQFLLRQEQMW